MSASENEDNYGGSMVFSGHWDDKETQRVSTMPPALGVPYSVSRHSNFKRVYLAGPYRGIDKAHTTANIQDARTHAIRVHELGGFAITPHLLCALFDYDIPDSFLEQSGRGGHRYWLDGLLDLLLYCDCVYVFNADPKSKGTAAEVELATRHGIPVFYTEQDLETYLNSGVKNDQTTV